MQPFHGFFNLNFYKIYFSGAVLGPGCCTGFSPAAASGGRSPVAVHSFLAPWHVGIFPDQGSNLSPALAGGFFTT